MCKLFKTITVILSIFCISCVNNNKATSDKTLGLFFSKTDWNDFNSKTLTENKLSHFMDNKIDFFNRESFFSFMKASKLETPYDDFYLVEIENPNGERATSRKIIAISFKNKVTYLGIKKGIDWNKTDLSKEEINEFKYETLKIGTKHNADSYILVTHIKSDKY